MNWTGAKEGIVIYALLSEEWRKKEPALSRLAGEAFKQSPVHHTTEARLRTLDFVNPSFSRNEKGKLLDASTKDIEEP